VQSALDEQGVDHEVVKGPLRASRREALEQISGQRKYLVIELAHGAVYREESAEMATRIRAGKLGEADRPPAGS
jgi:hypothetical protein